MMHNICRLLIGVFALAYIFALGLLAIGTFGLFGVVRDSMSGVYLIPLGMPWNIFLLSDAPEVLLPWIGILAPLLNLAILLFICRFFRAKGR